VAGCLDGFPAAQESDRFHGAIPVVRNYRAPWSWRFGLSHILYFKGFERHRSSHPGSRQKLAIADWVSTGRLDLEDADPGPARRFVAFLVYVLIVLSLWLAASGFAHAVVTAADFLLAQKLTIDLSGVGFVRIAGTVGGAALALILMIGVLRWARESGLNQRLATADGKSDKVIGALRRQKWAAILLGIPLILAVLAALSVDLFVTQAFPPDDSRWVQNFPWEDLGRIRDWAGWWTLIVAGIGTGLAAWAQAIINHKDHRVAAPQT
jgi:hypothetical protein